MPDFQAGYKKAGISGRTGTGYKKAGIPGRIGTGIGYKKGRNIRPDTGY